MQLLNDPLWGKNGEKCTGSQTTRKMIKSWKENIMIGLIFWTKNNWADNYGIFRKAISSNQCNFRLHGKLHLCQEIPVLSAKFRLENSIHCFNAKDQF